VRRLLLPLLLLALAAPASAGADAYLPPRGEVFHGVAGGNVVDAFARQTGRAPSVFQLFVAWGDSGWAFRRAEQARPARLMLHLSTYNGPGTRERITPAQIARGDGDRYLVALNRQIVAHNAEGGPVYLRVMSEMNGHWNPYAAFDRSGRARPGHSTAQFRAAWRRIATIVRGGPAAERLTGEALERARVALMWVPQVAGAPDTRANAPRAYWPGDAYVDWVGTDFYSRFPNWAGLERFHRQFRGRPFVFGEYAVWGRDDPAFLRRLFAWSRARRDVRMLVYNQGSRTDGPFRLGRHPRSRAALRVLLRQPWIR
jgi:mannan endo-1,4-beta-mannosidase